MADDLPRVTYVGDIPVEESYQSSVMLYRLLQDYPPDRLQIVETRAPASAVGRRLPGVAYAFAPAANRRRLRGAARGVYAAWLTASAARHAARLLPVVASHRADAILTVGSGFGWLLAAALARRQEVPLHLIAHDDWPKLSGVDRLFTAWLRRRYGAVYRAAASRLCVSPFMIDEFARRYGVGGSLLAPTRPSHLPAVDAAARPLAHDQPIVVGFAGGSGSHVMPGLASLARALAGGPARVIVHGPFDDRKQRHLRSFGDVFEFRGFTAYAEMMASLRTADVLFAPMAFDAASRDNMMVSFPSKLVDYTAVGRPILIFGPPHCSAARWARANDGVAVVVDRDDPAALSQVIESLKGDVQRRHLLGRRAIEVGAACFDAARGRAVLAAALRGSACAGN